MPERKVYALECPGCGAALRVREAEDSFACSYCGASVRVEREGGIVSLRLLTEAMLGVRRGTDKTAAELALTRLPKEITALRLEHERLLKQIAHAEERAPLKPLPVEPSLAGLAIGIIRGYRGRWLRYWLRTTGAVLLGVGVGMSLVLGSTGLVTFLVLAPVVVLLEAYVRATNDYQDYLKIAKDWNESPERTDAVRNLEVLPKRDAAIREQLAGLERRLAEARAVVDS